MAHVNYQQVVERLLVLAASKSNIGQRELLACIGRFIDDATVPDDQYAAFLARFGEEVLEGVLNVLPDDHAGIPASAAPLAPTSGLDHPTGANGHGGSWKHPQQRQPVPA